MNTKRSSFFSISKLRKQIDEINFMGDLIWTSNRVRNSKDWIERLKIEEPEEDPEKLLKFLRRHQAKLEKRHLRNLNAQISREKKN